MAKEKTSKQRGPSALSSEDTKTATRSRLLTPTFFRGAAVVKPAFTVPAAGAGPVKSGTHGRRLETSRRADQPTNPEADSEDSDVAAGHKSAKPRTALYPRQDQSRALTPPRSAAGPTRQDEESTPIKPLESPKESPRSLRGAADMRDPLKTALRSPANTPVNRTKSGAVIPKTLTNLHSPYQTTPPTGSRSALSNPPRIRVVVASNTRYPPAQRYDGFAGVPAFIGAPDVILFTPRRSPELSSQTPAASAPSNQGQSAPSYSPPAPDTTTEANPANRPDSNVTFLQVWILSAVAMGTFALPLGLLLLSYRATNGPPISFATATMPTSTTSKPTTAVLSHGIPARCFTPVRLNRSITISNSSYVRHPLPVQTHKIFCLFNSSRLGGSMQPDMTLVDMPLHYCGAIIYWSLGVAGGIVRSRVEDFDNATGLFKLAALLRSLRLNITIFVTVGGYPEESAHFSLLGRDAGKLARFVSSLMNIARRNDLGGVTIHWVSPEPTCRLPEDATTLSSLVSAIRQAYRSAGHGTGDIAIMLPPEESAAGPIVRLLAERVEWIFLETHLLQPAGRTSRDACSGLERTVRNLISLLQAGPNEHKICTGFSLAPLVATAVNVPRIGSVIDRFSSQISPYTGRAGTTSMQEVCTGGPSCIVWARGLRRSCVVVRKIVPTSYGRQTLYVFQDAITLLSIFSHNVYSPAVNLSNRCAVLYDIDVDNFRDPCPGLNMGFFSHLDHFATIMTGLVNSTEIEHHVPPC